MFARVVMCGPSRPPRARQPARATKPRFLVGKGLPESVRDAPVWGGADLRPQRMMESDRRRNDLSTGWSPIVISGHLINRQSHRSVKASDLRD